MASKLVLKSYNVGTGELIDQWSEDVAGVPKIIRTSRENPPSKFAIATDMGEVFVCKHNGEKIYRVDLGYNPTDLDVNEIGRLAVWDGINKKLEVYDETGMLKKTLTTGTTPALPHNNWKAIGYKGDKVWLSATRWDSFSPDIMRIDFSEIANPSIDWQINITTASGWRYPSYGNSMYGQPGIFVLTGGSEALVLVERNAAMAEQVQIGGIWVNDSGGYAERFTGNLGGGHYNHPAYPRSVTLDNNLFAAVRYGGVVQLIRRDGVQSTISTHSTSSDVCLSYDGLKLVQSNGTALEYYTCIDTANLVYELNWYKTLINEDVPVLMTDDAAYVLAVDGDVIKVFDSMGTQKYSYTTLWNKKPTPFIREYV